LVDGAATGIKAAAGGVTTAANAVAHSVVDAFDFVKELPGKVGAFFSDAWSRVKGWVGGFGSAAGSVAHAVLSSIVDVVKDVPGKVGEFFSSAKGKIDGWVDNAGNAAGNVGRAILNGVVNFVTDIPGKVVDALKSAKEKLGEWTENFANAALNLGKAIANGITEGVETLGGLLGKALKAAGGIAADVGHAIENWVNDNTLFGDHIHINLPGPVPDIDFDLPALATGARGFLGGLALVGERGPELALLPQGSDVYTAEETRRIFRALAGDGLAALSQGAAALISPPAVQIPGAIGGGSSVVHHPTYDTTISAPGGGSPEPEMALAIWDTKLRARGGVG
jgi:phage-related protein